METKLTPLNPGTNPDPVTVLEAYFPEKEGRTRKLKHLWSEYWRVNFYDHEKQLVVESYFARVNGAAVNVMKN